MSDIGNFQSYFTPQMDVGKAVDRSNQVWDNFGNMGVALSKLSQEQEALQADKEYKQQKMGLEREALLQDKSNKDRQYLLDYQKTINDSKAKEFDMFRDMQKLSIDQNKEERAAFDFRDKVQKQEYVKQNAPKYAEAWATGDLSKLSAKDQAMMDPKDRLSLYRHVGTMAKSNKDKAQVSNFYDNFGEDLLKIETNLKVDPITGKSNGQELLNPLREKMNIAINNGKIDSRIAFQEYGRYIGIYKKQLGLMGGSSGSTTPPTEFTKFDLNKDGLPVNPSNYVLNTPEGQQQLLQDQARIALDPNASSMIAKVTRNKGGISGITTIKPPKKQKESIFTKKKKKD